MISEEDEKFSYFVDVGVNPYVTVQLSFLPESEKSCTRTAARSFCPEFDHHMEVSCDLLLHMSSGETCSLAEQLQQASAIFTVWNRESHKGLRFCFTQFCDESVVNVSFLVAVHHSAPFCNFFCYFCCCSECS